LLDWYEKDGWVEVPDGLTHPEVGDVFMVAFDKEHKIPTHCAVYTGNGLHSSSLGSSVVSNPGVTVPAYDRQCAALQRHAGMTLRNIYLYESLKDKFDGPYKFDIATPGEAIRALSANFKEFLPTIRDGSWSIFMGSEFETADSMTLDLCEFHLGNSDDVHIMPALTGRKNAKGIISIVLGVALLATGIGGAFMAAAVLPPESRWAQRLVRPRFWGSPTARSP
jgi:hypothetical protein